MFDRLLVGLLVFGGLALLAGANDFAGANSYFLYACSVRHRMLLS